MKTRIIFGMVAAAMLTVSCENYLNIIPDGQVKREEMLKTPEGIEDALFGAYSQMRHQSLYGMALSIYGIEVLAHNMDSQWSDFSNNMGTYNWEYSEIRDWSEALWTEMYHNISNVNSVLDADLVRGAKEFPYTIYKGEALALRAFMHFDLVRLFAPQYTLDKTVGGIPYQTEFSLNTPDFESLEANYSHILADLTEAESLLLDEAAHAGETQFMLDRQTHLNLHAVRAELARVHLTMGNREKAAEYAGFLVRSNKEAEKEKIIARLRKIIEDFGGTLEVFGDYPAWEYRRDSDFRDGVVAAWRTLYKRDPQVLTIHAGLECGILQAKMPGLDAISIGPNILDIHSPNEKLDLRSTERTINLVLKILETL